MALTTLNHAYQFNLNCVRRCLCCLSFQVPSTILENSISHNIEKRAAEISSALNIYILLEHSLELDIGAMCYSSPLPPPPLTVQRGTLHCVPGPWLA